MSYPRDLVGYGRRPPDPRWPGRARLALQIVLNYEEGGERAILHGDAESEAFLQEVVGMSPLPGVRNLQVESVYEYGSRVGFWRLLRLFAERDITISVFAVAMALERHPEAARRHRRGRPRGGEPRLALDRLPVRERGRGARAPAPRRREPDARDGEPARSAGTRAPQPEHAPPRGGGTAGSSTTPTPTTTTCRTGSLVGDTPHLVVPYTLDNNDMKFGTPQGFNTGDDFFTYLRDAFDTLYAEGPRRRR